MAARSEFEAVLRELAQQQSSLSQQQTALLQLQTESLRLQRLLIEHAIVGAPTEEVATVVTTDNPHEVAQDSVMDSTPAGVSVAPLEDADANAAPPTQSVEARPADDSPFGELAKGDVPSGNPASGMTPIPAYVPRSRAARYLQPAAASPVRPVSRQDVDRVARLYETGDAAHMVLNFGQYIGATLVQIAQMDPDYVHQLALTAQRPEVRAAARQMVIALEEVAHKARPARPASRRSRSTR
jgi:hypothetical protein